MIILEDNELEKIGIDQHVIDQIQQDEDYSPYEEEINPATEAMVSLTKAITSLVEKPQVSPEQPAPVDISPLLQALAKVQETQTELIKTINSKKHISKSWDFTVTRDQKGNIKNISAKEIPA